MHSHYVPPQRIDTIATYCDGHGIEFATYQRMVELVLDRDEGEHYLTLGMRELEGAAIASLSNAPRYA